MNDLRLTSTAMVHVTYSLLRSLAPGAFVRGDDRDRGAVSIEQVLWYAAAAISVAVIAAIIWGQIRETAETDVTPPAAP